MTLIKLRNVRVKCSQKMLTLFFFHLEVLNEFCSSARFISMQEFLETSKYFFDDRISGNSSYKFLSIGPILYIKGDVNL